MSAKYLRSGPYEDTPVEEIPDDQLKLYVKAISGSGHPFSPAEQKLLLDEFARRAPRFAEETAAKELEAAIRRGEVRPESEPETASEAAAESGEDELDSDSATRPAHRRGRR